MHDKSGKVLFWTMFSAVVVAFFGMVIYSLVMPALNSATTQVTTEVAKTDTSGVTGNVVNTVNNIPDPKDTVKVTGGNFLYWLLTEHPFWFFVLAAVVTGVLIYVGVSVKSVSNF